MQKKSGKKLLLHSVCQVLKVSDVPLIGDMVEWFQDFPVSFVILNRTMCTLGCGYLMIDKSLMCDGHCSKQTWVNFTLQWLTVEEASPEEFTQSGITTSPRVPAQRHTVVHAELMGKRRNNKKLCL